MSEPEASPSFSTDFPRRLESLDERLAGFERRLTRVLDRVDAAPGAAAPGQAAGAYLLFVPSPSGYRLVEASGPVPVVGTPVELPEGDGLAFSVAKLARSPLPGDARACAYLAPD